MRNVALVVMERGSDWPGHVASLDDVIAFSLDDAALLPRTEEKLAALAATSHDVKVAILACNDTIGKLASERRTQVARALLAAVSRSTCGRLVLSSTAGAPQLLRHELMALAGALTPQIPRASGATITLRFNEAPAGSTRHRVVRARENRSYDALSWTPALAVGSR